MAITMDTTVSNKVVVMVGSVVAAAFDFDLPKPTLELSILQMVIVEAIVVVFVLD